MIKDSLWEATEMLDIHSVYREYIPLINGGIGRHEVKQTPGHLVSIKAGATFKVISARKTSSYCFPMGDYGYKSLVLIETDKSNIIKHIDDTDEQNNKLRAVLLYKEENDNCQLLFPFKDFEKSIKQTGEVEKQFKYILKDVSTGEYYFDYNEEYFSFKETDEYKEWNALNQEYSNNLVKTFEDWAAINAPRLHDRRSDNFKNHYYKTVTDPMNDWYSNNKRPLTHVPALNTNVLPYKTTKNINVTEKFDTEYRAINRILYVSHCHTVNDVFKDISYKDRIPYNLKCVKIDKYTKEEIEVIDVSDKVEIVFRTKILEFEYDFQFIKTYKMILENNEADKWTHIVKISSGDTYSYKTSGAFYKKVAMMKNELKTILKDNNVEINYHVKDYDEIYFAVSNLDDAMIIAMSMGDGFAVNVADIANMTHLIEQQDA